MSLTELASNAARIAPLAVPMLLGALATRVGLVTDEKRAIGALNTFVLYFAFPALVAGGVLDSQFSLPTDVGFWLTVPLVQALLLGWAWTSTRRSARETRGAAALVGLFGNTAYLGLPYAVSLYGDGAAGFCALLVAFHVAGSVAFGPWLLVRWGGGDGAFDPGRVLRQPLLWAPWVGLAGRALPSPVGDGVAALIQPLGAGAAPAALFMLGIYLYANREALTRLSRPVVLHTATRLAIAPLLTAVVCTGFFTVGLLSDSYVGPLVLMSGMPAAIATFSFAEAFDVARAEIAAAIVISTLVGLASLPVLATLASALGHAIGS